jgi:patatin-related protein
MREKELRIALVCFGGVSLAVYMHGISKEILKLVRASRALHGISDRAKRAKAAFLDNADPENREYDTESIYFELLREIGHKVELRVVVDVIAGASAGGINGTMLARALSHDLPLGPQRNLWLDNADVSVLLSSTARAGRGANGFSSHSSGARRTECWASATRKCAARCHCSCARAGSSRLWTAR